ncbi:DnaG5 [Candidatus Magnetomorum sp. HK-1]|nr:DnaG5 [Candidatus Magnetomorum sp. HK-1]
MKRFSKIELFEIRNLIPMQQLMEDLQILSIQENKIFRFLCPICKGYNTSINHETNLGRCFNCNKNFNTIDITIKIRTTNFVDTVKYLKKYLSHYQTRLAKQNTNIEPLHKEHTWQKEINFKKSPESKNDSPIKLSKILQNIIKPEQKINSNENLNWSEYCRSNDKRLFIIEQKVALALNMLDKLQNKTLKN